jgi:hypothetical protein
MSDTIQRYGHIDDETYPLAAWIWGHRLRSGQHWMEYLLEFLNVLAGFEYQLGQGLDHEEAREGYRKKYARFSRLGLRRFVFYDDREKTKHPYDDQAKVQLWERLQEHVATESGAGVGECLTTVQGLLRAFSAIEEDRSWYAKSLFPAHHNLLFWQADRNTKPRHIDDTITFTKRNFFARGGEVYYLILSAGTEYFPERRAFIAQRLQSLLHDHNRTLGDLAGIVDNTWRDLQNNGTDGEEEQSDKANATLGWIVDPSCQLYSSIAADVTTFLQSNLDSLECLDLLAHLIGFHLVQYIYHRAHPTATLEEHAAGTCLIACRPLLLIDALNDEGGGVIRNASAALFREHELRQEQKARAFVRTQIELWVAELAGDANLSSNLLNKVKDFFSLGETSGPTRQAYIRQTERLQEELARGTLPVPAFAREYADLLARTMMDDFRKHFLGVHRKLTKSIGLVAPKKGPSARFILSDNLLKTLVLANIPPNGQMTFGDFLARLYERYGIIVGSGEATQSGLLERQRINIEYYNRNRTAFLEKMKRAGLVVQYSDATALVKGSV